MALNLPLGDAKGEIKMGIHLYSIAVGACAGAVAGAGIALRNEVATLKQLATRMKTWGQVSISRIIP
ncbi:MAG: hypothetical protein DMG28_02615 [Acidobacteria bacterium]|nr:MAG: hypothetical protein DMG28_02615 [Acidobacteriota bacterium]